MTHEQRIINRVKRWAKRHDIKIFPTRPPLTIDLETRADFIFTSGSTDYLPDSVGNRRFFCLPVFTTLTNQHRCRQAQERLSNRTGMVMNRTAEISKCGRYRYHLARWWEYNKPSVTFIMLNPSTADANVDDPTIKRCIKFAQRWGCGGIQVVNLFALRTPSPDVMKASAAPEGIFNPQSILNAAQTSAWVICAWGNHGAHRGQAERVMKILQGHGVKTYCLGTTDSGQPKHPLSRGKGFIPYDFKPIPYNTERNDHV